MPYPVSRQRGKETKGNLVVTDTSCLGTLRVNSEMVLNKLVGAASWRGVTNILSGTATITVSATYVDSANPPITALGQTTVASHRDLVTSVDSVVTGTSFSINVQNATLESQEIVYHSII